MLKQNRLCAENGSQTYSYMRYYTGFSVYTSVRIGDRDTENGAFLLFFDILRALILIIFIGTGSVMFF